MGVLVIPCQEGPVVYGPRGGNVELSEEHVEKNRKQNNGCCFCLVVVQVSFIVFEDALGTEHDGSAIVVTSTVKGKYGYFHYFKF